MANQTFSDFGGGYNSPNRTISSPSKAKLERKAEGILPLCVRQIRDCPYDEFALFGIKPQMVVLVGILRELDVQSTKATFKLEDHTGDISAILWLEGDSSTTTDLAMLKEGSYIKCHATLRTQGNQKVLMAVNVRAVKHPGEITIHLLEVIYARMEAEKMSNKGNTTSGFNSSSAYANNVSLMDTGDHKENGIFTPVQNKIFNILKECKSEVGVDKRDIMSKFPSNQHGEVSSALDFLLNEGHAFTTLDSEHSKLTESM